MVTAEVRQTFNVLTNEFQSGYVMSNFNKIKTGNAQPETTFTLRVTQYNVKLYFGTHNVKMQGITKEAMKDT
jgi:hypothetical protein